MSGRTGGCGPRRRSRSTAGSWRARSAAMARSFSEVLRPPCTMATSNPAVSSAWRSWSCVARKRVKTIFFSRERRRVSASSCCWPEAYSDVLPDGAEAMELQKRVASQPEDADVPTPVALLDSTQRLFPHRRWPVRLPPEYSSRPALPPAARLDIVSPHTACRATGPDRAWPRRRRGRATAAPAAARSRNGPRRPARGLGGRLWQPSQPPAARQSSFRLPEPVAGTGGHAESIPVTVSHRRGPGDGRRRPFSAGFLAGTSLA